MDRDGLIDSFATLALQEKWAIDNLSVTREAADLNEVRGNIFENLKAVGKAGDVKTILGAERMLLESEREFFTNSPAMQGSLASALDELAAAEITSEKVHDRERYRGQVDEAYRSHKSRSGDLPIDEARQFFKSHNARLLNMDKARLSDDEKRIVDIRRANLRVAEKTYIADQRQALGIGSEPARARGRDPGRGPAL